MNWILDTYSDVYATAMMSESKKAHHAAPAKDRYHVKRPSVLGLFSRR